MVMAMMLNGVDEALPREVVCTGPLLCVSRLEPDKGVDMLLTAFGLLSEDRPALRLEILGDGPLAPALRSQARDLGLDDRVRFLGALPISEVRTALRRCAMLILPCPIEEPGDRYSFPEVLMEAMSCGTPVVTTDVLGVPNMVRHDATGVLVASEDAAGLALAVTSLLDDPARAAGIGAAGRRLVVRLHGGHGSTAELQRIWGGADR
jgi:colanic acid/amylovoran biosynthesis glycosyltransferase